MYLKAFIVIGSEIPEKLEEVESHVRNFHKKKVEILQYSDKFICPEVEDAIFLLYLNEKEIKDFFDKSANKNVNIGIIPNKKLKFAIKSYGISSDIYEAIDDCFNNKLLRNIDLFKCNGEVVFNRVSIGTKHEKVYLGKESVPTYAKIKQFISSLKHMNFKKLTITTAKEQSINTAALGLTIIDHTSSLNYNINENLSFCDGKLNLFILAPTSIISYIYYMILIFFYQKFSVITLPKSIGFIRASSLKITSESGLDFEVDETLVSSKEINLEIVPKSIYLHIGKNLAEKIQCNNNNKDDKETIKAVNMPRGEIRDLLLGGNIPFFKKADEEYFKELFSSLRSNAELSFSYSILLILSVLLATIGLFQNSSPVIIGAMILAPLMSPIISLSMGIIRADRVLMMESGRTLMIGIVMALLFSCILALIIPLETLTEQMKGRLNPNILDLAVAVFSGIAGAYANAKEEIAKSLAGVAIAVALVPPLSVTGIGIGWWDPQIIYGSFLLFITNLVGITIAAALTFIVLGYSPIKRAKKGVTYSLFMLLVISIPLALSFKEMIEQNSYYKKLSNIKEISLNGKKVSLKILQIASNVNDTIDVDIEVISKERVEKEEFAIIKKEFERILDKKTIVCITAKTKTE